jgi:hypothetical protein
MKGRDEGQNASMWVSQPHIPTLLTFGAGERPAEAVLMHRQELNWGHEGYTTDQLPQGLLFRAPICPGDSYPACSKEPEERWQQHLAKLDALKAFCR